MLPVIETHLSLSIYQLASALNRFYENFFNVCSKQHGPWELKELPGDVAKREGSRILVISNPFGVEIIAIIAVEADASVKYAFSQYRFAKMNSREYDQQVLKFKTNSDASVSVTSSKLSVVYDSIN